MFQCYLQQAHTSWEEYIDPHTAPELIADTSYLSVSLLGDFNDALHNVYDMARTLGMKQLIKGQTHNKGNTLDLVFTNNEDAKAEIVHNADVADHFPITLIIPDDLVIRQTDRQTEYFY